MPPPAPPAATSPVPPVELQVTGVAVGGDGVARDADGRVVLVAGALPGERVRASVVAERRNHARAVAVSVVAPAEGRVAPPCPYVDAGCGGCGWQHVAVAAQRDLKVSMVVDALRRLGRVDAPAVAAGPALPTVGYRTTLRGVADDVGRFALRRRQSHELVAVPGCLVAHPLVAAVLDGGRFPPGAEVTVRVGARTGEALVVVDPAVGDGTAVPDGVRVIGGDELSAGRRAWIHEEVAGRRLRVSARSFFQAQPEGAEALVAGVGAALGPPPRPGAHLVDLYGGVGPFAATLGPGSPGGSHGGSPGGSHGEAAGWRVTVVEASASAAADARVNLAGLDARVVRSDVGRWRPRRAHAVVADPPRAGLGRDGVRAVAGTRAERVALVSCDAGALGRDAALLRKAGYRFVEATLVDQFAGTPHVEVVSTFVRR